MSERLKKILNHVIYTLVGNAVYGFVLYLIVSNLAKISLIYAYVGNFAFLFAVLAFDEFAMRRNLEPEKMRLQLQKAGDQKSLDASIRFARWSLEHYMSFKTFLFIFYIAVLVFSQILRFYPQLAGVELTAFINTIDYSVLILLAAKDFGEEFTKDKIRSHSKLEEFDRFLEENPITFEEEPGA